MMNHLEATRILAESQQKEEDQTTRLQSSNTHAASTSPEGCQNETANFSAIVTNAFSSREYQKFDETMKHQHELEP